MSTYILHLGRDVADVSWQDRRIIADADFEAVLSS